MKRLDAIRDNALATAMMSRAVYYSMVKLREDSDLTPVRLVEHWAEQQPNNLAITGPEGTLTYRALNRRANAVARVLQRRGAGRGQRLALVMGSRPEFLIAMLGAAKLGMCTALIPARLKADALAHALRVARPDWLILGGECHDDLLLSESSLRIAPGRVWVWEDPQTPQAEGAQDDFGALVRAASGDALEVSDGHDMRLPFVLLCSGGPSELPRMTAVTNQRFLQGCYYFGQAVLKSNPTDVAYTAGIPLTHRAAFYQAWGVALTGGGAVALRRRFDASRFWHDCDEFDVSLLCYLGHTCRGLMRAAEDPKERTHRVRAAVGSGLGEDLWEPFKERFAIPTIYENYGATEGHVGLINLSGSPGMVGRLGAGRGQVLARVHPLTEEFVREGGRLVPAQEGESGILLAKIGPLMPFDGFEDPADNAASVLVGPFGRDERYINTRDRMTLHAGGWVSFSERVGDDFHAPGTGIRAADVADVCAEVRGVRDACAYPLTSAPDTQHGAVSTSVMAALVVDASFEFAELSEHLKRELPESAWPRFVRLESSLPQTSSHRPIKARLYAEGADPATVRAPLFRRAADGSYQPCTGPSEHPFAQQGEASALVEP